MIYREIGERVLHLTREVVHNRASHVLIPFPLQQTDRAADHIAVMAPSLSSTHRLHPQPLANEPLVVGWLVPTLNLNSLNALATIIREVADMSEQWTIRLIEAAPRRRGWVCDLDSWLKEHPAVQACFEKMVPYQTSELSSVDLLVALPCDIVGCQSSRNLNAAKGAGSEEACWVVLQAIASRVPLLGSDTLRAWFAGEEDPGYFVEAGEPKIAAQALRELALDPALRQRCAEAAGRVAESQFSPAATIDAYEKLYAAALSAPIPSRGFGRPRSNRSSDSSGVVRL